MKDDDDFADNVGIAYAPWRPTFAAYPVDPRAGDASREQLYRQSRKQPHRDFGTARDVDTAKYFSTEIMALEWDRLWTKCWLMVGNISDVPTPGSYMKVDLGKESVLVVRGEGDKLSAMYNVCQHRGTRLVDKDFGKARKFVCPFHHWEFATDGRLLKVAKAETFRKTALCHDLDIPKVKVDTWKGMIFINLDPQAGGLLEFIPADFREMMDAYELERMIRVVDTEQEWPINWKASMEAFIEGYHVESVHSQLNPYFDSYYVQTDMYDNGFNRQIYPFMKPMPTSRNYQRQGLSDESKLFLREAGLTPDEFPENDTDVRQAVFDGKRRNQARIGMDYSRFTDEQLADDWNISIFPAASFNIHPEGVLFQRWWPHPHDPRKSIYHYQVYAMPGVKEMPTYMGVPTDADTSGKTILPRLHAAPGDLSVLGSVLSQDAIFLPRLQLGIESAGFRGSIFSEQEIRLRAFHAEYYRWLGIEGTSAEVPCGET